MFSTALMFFFSSNGFFIVNFLGFLAFTVSNIWRSEQEKCQILAICMFYNVHFLSLDAPGK